jgi:hypothetical protein
MPNFDTLLKCGFHSGAEDAHRAALREAANSGGAIVAVETLEFQPRTVLAIGSVPAAAVEYRAPHDTRPVLKGTGVGALHTTWGAAIGDQCEGPLGYLVVRGPLRLSGAAILDDQDRIRVALPLHRECQTIRRREIGPRCCARCNRPINSARLAAVDAAFTCTDCETKKEVGR